MQCHIIFNSQTTSVCMEIFRLLRCHYFPFFQFNHMIFQWKVNCILRSAANPRFYLQLFMRTKLILSILSGMSIYIMEAKIPQYYQFQTGCKTELFQINYWIKCLLWTIVSSWILLLETRMRNFVNADVPGFCNPCKLQTSLIAESLIRHAYKFGCKLQNNPVLTYFARCVLPWIVFKS